MKNSNNSHLDTEKVFNEVTFLRFARKIKCVPRGTVGYKRLTAQENFEKRYEESYLTLQKGEKYNLFICKVKDISTGSQGIMFAPAGSKDVYFSLKNIFPDFFEAKTAYHTIIEEESYSLIRRSDDGAQALVPSKNLDMDQVKEMFKTEKKSLIEPTCQPIIVFDENRNKPLFIGYGFFKGKHLSQMFDVKDRFASESQIPDLKMTTITLIEIGRSPQKVYYDNPLLPLESKEFFVSFDERTKKLYYSWEY